MTFRSPHGQLRAARELLGLSIEQSRDRALVRRAYRRLAAIHPPDRDPGGFQAIRGAYELLSEPIEPMRGALLRSVPCVPPPRLTEDQGAPQAVPGATAVSILRAVVATLPTASLLTEPKP